MSSWNLKGSCWRFIDVFLSPVADCRERSNEACAEWGERVLNSGWIGGERPPVHKTVTLETSQRHHSINARMA